jgi:hypothetical protein
MYFDAVLDDRMKPVFNGTPEETEKWLKENPKKLDLSAHKVCYGYSMGVVSVSEYINKKKYLWVLELVKEAMEKQDAASYYGDTSNMGYVATEIAQKITKII